MADRGKVLKGLEHCVTESDCRGCVYCEQMNGRYDGYKCDCIADALALLKEQEAKNVIAEKRKILFDDSYDEARYYEDTFYHCPSCNRHLSRTHMNKDIRFCSSCGQEVTWE